MRVLQQRESDNLINKISMSWKENAVFYIIIRPHYILGEIKPNVSLTLVLSDIDTDPFSFLGRPM